MKELFSRNFRLARKRAKHWGATGVLLLSAARPGKGTALDRGNHPALQGCYNYFGRHPEKVIAFFNKDMK
jgi:hypothetical protein